MSWGAALWVTSKAQFFKKIKKNFVILVERKNWLSEIAFFFNLLGLQRLYSPLSVDRSTS